MTGVSTARKSNGVLSVPSTPAANETPKATKAKDSPRGKKVLVRRLPPGITEEEFRTILGEEWKSGNGKVEWTKFQEGHISQDPSNPSMPARCYLQVRSEDIPALAEVIQRSTWEDEKRTFNDSALVGPPYLEFSIYQKVPTTKRRTDSKQGTIDQDPDFMAFLDSLTQDPSVREVDAEQADDLGKADTKVTTTPLVEYLKEKKANKGKDISNAKSSKHSRHESQGGKPKGSQEESKKKGKDSKTDKAEKAADKEEKKTKEPLKFLTKKSTTLDSAEATKSTSTQASTSKTVEEAAPKSRRANIAAAAKILQRDLGLSPGSAHRRARQDAAKAEAAAKVDTTKEKDGKDSTSTAPAAPSQPSSLAPPSAPTAPKAQAAEGSRRSRGSKSTKQNAPSDVHKGKGTDNASSTAKSTPITTPVILKRKDDALSSGLIPIAPAAQASSTSTPPTGPKAAGKAASSNKSGPSQKKASSQPLVTAGATRAFVKHANPSQGVTEPLLKQAMETFGLVTFVEIDKRKGFAYVDFGDHDGLVKAISASPIPVAQGTVQVLERKEIKKSTQTPTQPASDKASIETPPDRPKRGGRGRGRRGGAANAGSTNPTNEAVGSSATPPPPPPTESSTAATAD